MNRRRGLPSGAAESLVKRIPPVPVITFEVKTPLVRLALSPVPNPPGARQKVAPGRSGQHVVINRQSYTVKARTIEDAFPDGALVNLPVDRPVKLRRGSPPWSRLTHASRTAHQLAHRGRRGPQLGASHLAFGSAGFDQTGDIGQGVPLGIIAQGIARETDFIPPAAPDGPAVILEPVLLNDPMVGSPARALGARVSAKNDAAAVIVMDTNCRRGQ